MFNKAGDNFKWVEELNFASIGKYGRVTELLNRHSES